MGLRIQKDSLILFQGDSITDSDRDRGDDASLGGGYAAMAAGVLRALYPELGLRFLNRGIGGDRVTHLRDRWESDTLAHRPDVLILMIGVNDTHLSVADKPQAPAQAEWQTMLSGLLLRVKAQNPGVRLVMLEPFLIPSAHESAAWMRAWGPDFAERLMRYREVALASGALLVPLHGLFAASYSAQCPPEYWALDGVHPTVPGHRLIAKALLGALGVPFL